MGNMSNTDVIIINIIGLRTRNEKNAPDKWSPRIPSKISPSRMVRAPSGHSKRVKQHRWLAKHITLAKLTAAQRHMLANGCSCKLTRISPRRLFDASESLRSALASVRDGVADALGIDDRDAEEGGLIAWTYEQDMGAPEVLIELAPISFPDAVDRMLRSKQRKAGTGILTPRPIPEEIDVAMVFQESIAAPPFE